MNYPKASNPLFKKCLPIKPARRAFFPVSIMLLACALTFSGVIFRGEILYLLDITIQNHPFQYYAFSTLKTGELPLWCRTIACGFPLFAEGQSGALYLPNIVFNFLLPTLHAITFNTIFHFLLTTITFYLYLKHKGFAVSAALISALSWGFGAYFTSHYILTPYFYVVAWFPLGLLILDRMRARRNWVSVPFVLFVALISVIGHPPGLFLSLICYTLYYLALLMTEYRERLKRLLLYICLLLMHMVIGVALSGVQVLPTLELALRSPRSSGLPYQTITEMSFPPRNAITMLFPFFFGQPGNDSLWALVEGYYWEMAIYPGLLILIMALIGVQKPHSNRIRLFSLISIAGICLMLGKYTPLYHLISLLPGAGFFRIPARFSLLFLVGLCGLAAEGFQRWETDFSSYRKRVIYIIIIVVIISAIFIAPNLGFLLKNQSVSDFYESARFLSIKSNWLEHIFVSCLFACVLSMVVFYRKHKWLQLRMLLLIALHLFDLKRVSLGMTHTLNPDYFSHSQTNTLLTEMHASGRIMSIINESNDTLNWHKGWLVNADSYKKLHDTLMMYTPTLYDRESCSLDGWSPLHTRSMNEFLSVLKPETISMAGVGVLVSPAPMQSQFLQPLNSSYPYLYRVKNTIAFASFGWSGKIIEGRDRKLYIPFLPQTLRNRELFVQGAPGLPQETSLEEQSHGEISVHWTGSNRFVMNVRCESPGLVLINQLFDPAWQFRLNNNTKAPATEAQCALTGIIAQRGRYTITATYEPQSVKTGLFLTCTLFFLLIIYSIIHRSHSQNNSCFNPSEQDLSQSTLYFRVIILAFLALLLWSAFFSGWWDSFSLSWLWKCHEYRQFLEKV